MGKNVYLVKKVEKNELSILIAEYKKNEKSLTFGRFFNGYAHNDSYFLAIRDGVITEQKKDDERSRITGYGNALESQDSVYAKDFPETLFYLQTLSAELQGYLARVSMVKTLDEYRYFPHVDKGYYYLFHKRYHVVLISSGSTMISAENREEFKGGDIFYLNNLQVHSGKHSHEHDERVHIIFDVLPYNLFLIMRRYFHWLLVERKVANVSNMNLYEGLKGFFYLVKAVYLSLFTYSNQK